METTTTRDIKTVLPRQKPDLAESCCTSESLPPVPGNTRVVALTDRLKALADETRLHMLELLTAHGEPLCVCEITERFDLSQSTISHHLRLLREAELIHAEKRGTWMYYAATAEGRRCLALVHQLV